MRIQCFFIGHRDAPAALRPDLQAAVERHITEYGVTEFVVGHYGAFDRMAAECVLAAKTQHPEVMLTLLLPYLPPTQKTMQFNGFDGSCYPPGQESVPHRAAIIRANRYAVDQADYLIAYVWQSASNARNLLDYARARRKPPRITLLARR